MSELDAAMRMCSTVSKVEKKNDRLRDPGSMVGAQYVKALPSYSTQTAPSSSSLPHCSRSVRSS